MAIMTTAISIQESLFRETEALAEQINISQNKLFTIAISDFVKRQQNRRLSEQINDAYDDAPDQKEKEHLRLMKVKHHKLLEEQW